MTKRPAGGVGVPPTKQRALLSAIITLIVVLSVGIYVGVSAGDGSGGDSPAGGGSGGNSAAPASTGTWVGAWSAAPVGGEPGTGAAGMAGRSVRNVVHTSAAGTSARITLSNLYGRSPLTLTHASIALAAGHNSSAAAPGTMRRLTFGGATSVTVPAGQQVLSDAVRLQVPQGADVLVTTYAPAGSGPVTFHPYARQTSYLADGDRVENPSGAPYTQRTSVWRYLTALDVLSRDATGTVVAFGDSITDGSTSTQSANRRWPDAFSRRLSAAVAAGRKDVPRYSVVNEGISGNQILTSQAGRPAENQDGLTRFARDVLDRPNVKVVIVDLGVNDTLHDADSDAILAGLRALVRQAHAHGVKVVGATLMPFGGYPRYTAAREAVRQRVNAAIRSGTVYDAVVDFDKALRDPYAPRRYAPEYDSGDHLHPGDRGYREMADTIGLTDLKGAVPARL
ncbi:SGNH/GDSL hydrolase family protein [Streptomyces sp. MBT53]|uniref:SGNH/GDSL hydrolase family protein n=1 Tax=Streptomyces sp. MBT53 TaxID=1488384 RepID=UPI00191205DD|nr:SGNH/GDSL hydrolase family protein [Streptomyces sp. MBT53]MBK6015868.1 SGNH/GDSL hydrolase family protein [Streptomyces sp. MBT53]